MEALEAEYQNLCQAQSDISDALPVLRSYASKVKHITEFGIRTAVSTTALLAAQPDTLISYDIELNLPHLEKLHTMRGRTDFRYYKGDTRLIDIEPTDFLFIDTAHRYEQMKIELARHTSNVSRYVAMHDTTGYRFVDEGHSVSEKRGIWPAIEEWLAGGGWEMCYELPSGWGFTVFQRKTSMVGNRKQPNAEGVLLLKEGEYGKGAGDIWYARPPGNHTGSLRNHTVVEHEDGTITVSPSILIDDGRNQWHGHLERGIWKKE